MRALCCADLHVKSNDLPRGTQLLRDIKNLCVSNELTMCFIIGDLLHEKDRFTIHCLNAVRKCLEEFKAEGITVYWIRGNHEVPLTSTPSKTIMPMYRHLAKIVVTPEILRGEDYCIYMLPWYTAELFRNYCNQLAQATYQDRTKTRILMAHIGLAEGVTNLGGFQVSQPIRLTDLHPESYHLTLLGDYHVFQKVSKGVYYLGAPISHQFGDDHLGKVWILDTDSREIEPVSLPSKFPKYATYEVELDETGETLATAPMVDPDDINRFKCHISAANIVRNLYRHLNPVIETYGASSPDMEQRRISSESGEADVLREWLKQRGWLETHYKTAMKYLDKGRERVES